MADESTSLPSSTQTSELSPAASPVTPQEPAAASTVTAATTSTVTLQEPADAFPVKPQEPSAASPVTPQTLAPATPVTPEAPAATSPVTPSNGEQLVNQVSQQDDVHSKTDLRATSCMKRDVYMSAERGAVDELRHLNWRHQKTPIGNNVLHVHVGRLLKVHKDVVTENVNEAFIQYVLDTTASDSVLLQTNARGDTPLHLAARFGHKDAVQQFLTRPELVNDIPGLLNKANKSKDTALHDAARAGHATVVELLVGQGCDHSSLQYMPNDLGETPIFLAAERGCTATFATILLHINPTTLDHRGPCGLTVLHAAVQRCKKYPSGIVQRILLKENSSLLIRVKNDEGQTPLHCCAAWNLRYQRNILRDLLRHDNEYNSAAYIQDNQGRTALHVAILNSNFKGAKMLIQSYPDCVEIVDNKGQNMVHYAAKLGWLGRFLKVLKRLPQCHKLINDKDNDGNTPLHLLVSTPPIARFLFINLLTVVRKCNKLDVGAFNNENLTPGDIFAANRRLHHPECKATKRQRKRFPLGRRINNTDTAEGAELPDEEISSNVEVVEQKCSRQKKIEERISSMKRGGEAQLVVAALIATVSFTAGFTMPGGFDQNPGENIGLAILVRKAAFVTFLVSDTVAFALSSLAVICFSNVPVQSSLQNVEFSVTTGHLLNSISLGALMIAFVTGVYAAVSHFPRLAFTIIAISSFYFFFYLFILLKACAIAMSHTHRNLRAPA